MSIGAHPSFNDPENFGRERMNLPKTEIKKLIYDQYDILTKNISATWAKCNSHQAPRCTQ